MECHVKVLKNHLKVQVLCINFFYIKDQDVENLKLMKILFKPIQSKKTHSMLPMVKMLLSKKLEML
jgi:hypothetical protein